MRWWACLSVSTLAGELSVLPTTACGCLRRTADTITTSYGFGRASLCHHLPSGTVKRSHLTEPVSHTQQEPLLLVPTIEADEGIRHQHAPITNYVPWNETGNLHRRTKLSAVTVLRSCSSLFKYSLNVGGVCATQTNRKSYSTGRLTTGPLGTFCVWSRYNAK